MRVFELLDYFKLKTEQEDYFEIAQNIEKGVVFRGTNLWILVFAIFIASLGLNLNSTAVIIGAMLVSPLMGPIMGLGFGMAVNDLTLLKKSIFNYLFAAGVSLATSTIYFLLSPINDAHSEILARTTPTIYDVLIAFFGGLAGILATCSKQKGNVLPGVAIATALMPPLCTAGYGLATWNFSYFFGAFYLFLINTVFIALASLITTRLLKFPFKQLPNEKAETQAKRIVWFIVLLTLIPSLYLGYDIIQRNKFEENAKRFILEEAKFPNNFLLSEDINSKENKIELTFGGEFINPKSIEDLKSQLKHYELADVQLNIRQGFAYLTEDKNQSKDQNNSFRIALAEKEKQNFSLIRQMDSLQAYKKETELLFLELKTQYPNIKGFTIAPSVFVGDTSKTEMWVSVIQSSRSMKTKELESLQKWIQVRMKLDHVQLYIDRVKN